MLAFWIRCTPVTAVLLFRTPFKVKMSPIRKQDVVKRLKALSHLVNELKPINGILEH